MRKLAEIKFDKEYRNKPEKEFSEKARALGWKVTKQGYPDFICYRENEIILVEVKRTMHRRLRKGQHRFMNAMKRFGVKCYRWSPDKDWLSDRTQYPKIS